MTCYTDKLPAPAEGLGICCHSIVTLITLESVLMEFLSLNYKKNKYIKSVPQKITNHEKTKKAIKPTIIQ